MPIEYPQLAIDKEDQLAAEAIGRVSGGLSETIVAQQIETRRELLKLIAAGLDEPICPELTNANPSSPHTVVIEAFAWLLSQQGYRLNQVPRQNLIAFANVIGIESYAATPAETMLQFAVDPPADTDVTIAAGTEVSSEDGKYVFQTAEELVIPFGEETGDVRALRTVPGRTLLSPNVLTVLVDSPAYVESVTNPAAIDSGTEAESLESVLSRIRRYMRRGERIVSSKDLEEAIEDEAMKGNGVVRVFPFIKNGNFENQKLVGHTTAVVMTKTGDPIDQLTRAAIAQLTDTAVGNQFIYVVDPTFVNFNIEANVRLSTGSPEGDVLAAIEQNLRAFYAAGREQFGRPILRSEIIAVIEGTEGVDRIVAGADSILIAPTVDTKLLEYEVAKLMNVTLNVV